MTKILYSNQKNVYFQPVVSQEEADKVFDEMQKLFNNADLFNDEMRMVLKNFQSRVVKIQKPKASVKQLSDQDEKKIAKSLNSYKKGKFITVKHTEIGSYLKKLTK